MTTLYAFPFACSLAVHIQLVQTATPHEIRWVERGPARRARGEGLAALNPKAKVPTIVQSDGTVWTEVVSILYTLDGAAHPERPAEERRQLLEWLALINTELHYQVIAPAYDPGAPTRRGEDARTRLLPPVLDAIATHLDRSPYLLGHTPCTADAYLLWALIVLGYRWNDSVQAPPLQAFMQCMMQRPAMARAIGIEQERRRT